jgi:hypothetical protein
MGAGGGAGLGEGWSRVGRGWGWDREDPWWAAKARPPGWPPGIHLTHPICLIAASSGDCKANHWDRPTSETERSGSTLPTPATMSCTYHRADLPGAPPLRWTKDRVPYPSCSCVSSGPPSVLANSPKPISWFSALSSSNSQCNLSSHWPKFFLELNDWIYYSAIHLSLVLDKFNCRWSQDENKMELARWFLTWF